MTPTARKFVIASVLSGKNADSSGKKRLAESAPRARSFHWLDSSWTGNRPKVV
jgi:hypothetical protein